MIYAPKISLLILTRRIFMDPVGCVTPNSEVTIAGNCPTHFDLLSQELMTILCF
jgi:hypothetical protein